MHRTSEFQGLYFCVLVYHWKFLESNPGILVDMRDTAGNRIKVWNEELYVCGRIYIGAFLTQESWDRHPQTSSRQYSVSFRQFSFHIPQFSYQVNWAHDTSSLEYTFPNSFFVTMKALVFIISLLFFWTQHLFFFPVLQAHSKKWLCRWVHFQENTKKQSEKTTGLKSDDCGPSA